MTELEILERAKTYLDKLANGVDPTTDFPVAEHDCVNNVRISRCLFYVSDVLRRVIENGGRVSSARVKKEPFSVSANELEKFPLSDNPITVSEITRRINDLVDPESVKKLKTTSINEFLVRGGFLEKRETANGRFVKRPTSVGYSIGISTAERTGPSGTYQVTVFGREAQRFVLDNMAAVIEINNQKKTRDGGDEQ
ncbi:MAG: hypothetical protein II736_08150 [Clostridia bacterium]|nr:hypothetical protein [Clostridia bacterium]